MNQHQQLDDWPRDPLNKQRYLCNKQHPMPQYASGLWTHDVTTIIDHCQHGCCQIVQCINCGAKWLKKE